MRQLDRALTTIENVVAAGALGLAALISIVNVILRQFDMSWFWTEEAVIYLIIYSTFIGAVITLRHNEHVSVDILGVFFKDKGKKWLALAAGVVTIIYLVIMAYLGWQLLAEPFSSTTVTPVLKLPLWVVELAVPLGMTLMLLRALEMLWRTWKHGVPTSEDLLAAEAEATGLTLDEIRATQGAISSGKDDVIPSDDGDHTNGDTKGDGR
ncbi:TRAP transporter small permease [Ornithinimicrobium faecis]|uniref:TRAP transporter small permease n=1 Tax=Ornithinimicrobium faecis TaxID=2934158 RepID=A0ABY4YSK4_9MICO|nr:MULTISPECIES: TRAP transporter small permease [unclassified Ornithinimicrobium]USQ79751.1 TRAP transporter small permease [Ornithinimicrobium sp. HY1793]